MNISQRNIQIERDKRNQNNWKGSVQTKLSYWMGILTIGIQFFLGFRHISELFGKLCILEGIFALSGILLLDILHGHGQPIYPKKFKPIHPQLIIRVFIIFGVIAFIQFIFQIVPLITNVEMGLAIVFCAVAEEYFFRGLLLEFFIKLGKTSEKFKVFRGREISLIEIFGILISGALFAGLHINYYGNVKLIGMVFVGGIWLGICYWYFRDLTANILAHFLLNTIFVIQTYYLVML
ncbi:MAG: lysostaphin resistance A-like protein [Candidatus Odinarchaeota archaeon]